MKSVFYFFTLLFFLQPVLSSAQISEEDRLNRCKTNAEALAKLEKDIPAKKAELKRIGTAADLKKNKSDSLDVQNAIKELKQFPRGKKDKNQTDKEYVMGVVEPLFDIEKKYTGKESLINYLNTDFDPGGKMVSSQPEQTLARLRMIREAIEKERSYQSLTQGTRTRLEAELKQMEDMQTYHRNRMIEMKCDESVTKETKEIKETNEVKPPPVRTEVKITRPGIIELTETSEKWGTFSVTLENVGGDTYEGVYNNNKKATFMLKASGEDGFSMQRISGTTAFYDGTRTGNSVTGRFLAGGVQGTFTATLK